MNTRSRAARLAGVLLAALVVAPLAATPSAGADEYPAGETIHPRALDKGPATPLLRVVGRTIIDGDVRVAVAGEHVSMVGRSGADYLVLTTDGDYMSWQLLRVTREGTTSRIAGGPSYAPQVLLADGGAHVALLGYTKRDESALRVLDTSAGSLVRRRVFGTTVSPLDFGTRRMVLGEWGRKRARQRTFWWNPFNNRVVKIADEPGYIADISADRFGVYLGDPYMDGCQKVMALSAPRTRLWRSCDNRVLEFSPNGKRMVTTHILSDGPGPNLVQVRGARGRLLDTYRSRWFGVIAWETDRRLLLQVGDRKTVAMVRCTLRRCERVSRVYRTNGRDPWNVMPLWTFAPESLLDR